MYTFVGVYPVWAVSLATLYFKVQFLLLRNHYYDFCLNKLLICCLLIVSKVVVIGSIGRDVEYGHAEYMVYKY